MCMVFFFLQDRFTKDVVVVAAQSKPKTGGYELQLPSMGSLTSKTSSQAFFLRILKVILQLRDAARLAAVKAKRKQVDATAPVPAAASLSSTPAVGTAPSLPGEPAVSGTPDAAASGSVPTAATTAEVTNEIPAPMEVRIVHDVHNLSSVLTFDIVFPGRRSR